MRRNLWNPDGAGAPLLAGQTISKAYPRARRSWPSTAVNPRGVYNVNSGQPLDPFKCSQYSQCSLLTARVGLLEWSQLSDLGDARRSWGLPLTPEVKAIGQLAGFLRVLTGALLAPP